MRKMIALAIALAAAPLAAQANDSISYTYAEAGLVRAEADMDFLGTLKANGGYLRGSWGFTPSTHVFGSYTNVSESERADGVRAKYTLEQAELGLGWHMNMSERIDFTADIAYVRLSDTLKVSGIPAETGYDFLNGKWEASTNAGRATLGLRGKPSARTEAWVRAGAMDGSDMDSEFYGTLGGQIKFDKTWGIVGEAQWIGSNTTVYMAGVRASF